MTAGVFTLLDPAPATAGLPDALLDVDLLCPNESEAALLSGFPVRNEDEAIRAAQHLHTRGARNVIVTRGKAGAVVCDHEGKTWREAAIPVAAVDTTAAGDAFAGALAVALARGEVLGPALRFAVRAGALAATRPGAQPGMPTYEALSGFYSDPES